MFAEKASDLINENVTYKPDWEVYARPASYMELVTIGKSRDWNRQYITISVEARVKDSNRVYAPNYFRDIWSSWSQTIDVTNIEDDKELYYMVLQFLIGHEIHEAREFLKTDKNRYEAPFHPHTEEGRRNWAAYHHDNQFPTH